MTNYNTIGMGALVALILLLIVMGYVYDIPKLYITGYVSAIVVAARIGYVISQRKKYTASTGTTGTNENINGGACNDIKTYNYNGVVDETWCNLNKSETDKTNLTRSANRNFHPSSNYKCSTEATTAYQNLENECGKIIIERKNSNNKKSETKWWDDFWTSPNNYTEPTNTPPQSTYYTKPQTDYSKMSDYDLRQSAQYGNQSAYKEQADRRFRDSPENVKSDPDARPDTDFCTIM